MNKQQLQQRWLWVVLTGLSIGGSHTASHSLPANNPEPQTNAVEARDSPLVTAARTKKPKSAAVISPIAEATLPSLDDDTEQPGTIQLVSQLESTPAPLALGYRDQLIDPTIEVETLGATTTTESRGWLDSLSPGSIGLEYRLYDSDVSGDSDASQTEQGFGLTLRQDSVSLGHFDLHAAATDDKRSPGADIGSGKVVRLQQRDFILSDHWRMHNSLGHFRAETPSLLALSYRLRLAQPVVQGAATRINNDKTDIRISGGKLGNYRGRTFPVFEDENSHGDILGLASTYQINGQWAAGLQWWDVNDALDSNNSVPESHTSVLGVAQYRNPVKTFKTQLHLLSNNGGGNGSWIDGEFRQQYWKHNFGAYYLEPDLRWIDKSSTILDDRQGVYWQGGLRRPRLNLSLGAELSQTNLDDDITLVARTSHSLFTNLNYQLSSRTTVGGALSIVDDDIDNSSSGNKETTVRAQALANRRFDLGSSAWRLTVTDYDKDTNSRTRYEGIWDHDWTINSPLKLRTGASYIEEDRETDTLEQTSLRLFGGRQFMRLGIDGGLSLAVLGDGSTDEGRSSHANLGIAWRIARAWNLDLDLNWNRNKAELVNGNETLSNEKNAYLSLRYDQNWGRPKASYGSSESQGKARIRGRIFFDANGNGLQEPDEAGAAQITVYLDGAYTVETDSRGDYEFWPVPSGYHTISLMLNNVPLPWGLRDDKHYTLSLRNRQEKQVDFGLIKINE